MQNNYNEFNFSFLLSRVRIRVLGGGGHKWSKYLVDNGINSKTAKEGKIKILTNNLFFFLNLKLNVHYYGVNIMHFKISGC